MKITHHSYIRFSGVVDGLGGTVKRSVYQEIMTGKRCKNAADFLNLIKQKSTSVFIDELSTNEIQDAHKTLGPLFSNVKPVPDIQKVHSMTVIDINKIECKFYSNCKEKTVVNF